MTEPENNLPWIAEDGGLPFIIPEDNLPFFIDDGNPGSPVDLDDDAFARKVDEMIASTDGTDTLLRIETWLASDAHGHHRKIHDEGVTAYLLGKAKEDNPYIATTDAGAWRMGWNREYYKANPEQYVKVTLEAEHS